MLPLIQTGGGSSGGGGVTSFTGDIVVYNNSGSTGAVTLSLIAQIANKVFAGPSSGGNAAPTFRSLVGADLPNPSASTLGGIQSLAAVGSRWINTISTSGVPSATQPAFSDISGQASLTTQVSGVLPPANGGVVNALTAGQGFWYAGPTQAAAVLNFSTNNTIAATANRIYLCQVVLEHRQKISQVTFSTGATAGITTGNNFGWGIYSADGSTKLTSINVAGVVATSATVTTAITPITLDPGVYWVAWVCTITTPTMNSYGNAGNTSMFGGGASQTKRWGFSSTGNVSAAGALPSSVTLPDSFLAQAIPVLYCEP